MSIKNWKQELFTIPNLLTLSRIGMIPAYMTIYRNATRPEDYCLAGGLLGLSCLTDLADGWIARRFHMTSRLGKILDPLADKATQLTLLVSLSLRRMVLRPLLWIFLAKECLQLCGVILRLHRATPPPWALMAGKVCTAVLFVTLTALVFFPGIPDPIAGLLATVDALCLTAAFTGYALIILKQ